MKIKDRKKTITRDTNSRIMGHNKSKKVNLIPHWCFNSNHINNRLLIYNNILCKEKSCFLNLLCNFIGNFKNKFGFMINYEIFRKFYFFKNLKFFGFFEQIKNMPDFGSKFACSSTSMDTHPQYPEFLPTNSQINIVIYIC